MSIGLRLSSRLKLWSKFKFQLSIKKLEEENTKYFNHLRWTRGESSHMKLACDSRLDWIFTNNTKILLRKKKYTFNAIKIDIHWDLLLRLASWLAMWLYFSVVDLTIFNHFIFLRNRKIWTSRKKTRKINICCFQRPSAIVNVRYRRTTQSIFVNPINRGLKNFQRSWNSCRKTSWLAH